MGVGRVGSRLCGNEEVTGLCPGLKKDLLVSLILRHMSHSMGGSSPMNSQEKGIREATPGREYWSLGRTAR